MPEALPSKVLLAEVLLQQVSVASLGGSAGRSGMIALLGFLLAVLGMFGIEPTPRNMTALLIMAAGVTLMIYWSPAVVCLDERR